METRCFSGTRTPWPGYKHWRKTGVTRSRWKPSKAQSCVCSKWTECWPSSAWRTPQQPASARGRLPRIGANWPKATTTRRRAGLKTPSNITAARGYTRSISRSAAQCALAPGACCSKASPRPALLTQSRDQPTLLTGQRWARPLPTPRERCSSRTAIPALRQRNTTASERRKVRSPGRELGLRPRPFSSSDISRSTFRNVESELVNKFFGRSLNLDTAFGERVQVGQRDRAQAKLWITVLRCRQRGSIQLVANHRMAAFGKMHTDLMRAACNRPGLDQGQGAAAALALILGLIAAL